MDPRTSLVLALVGASTAAPVQSQILSGAVVDGSGGAAVPLAAVFLLDRSGALVAETMADALGRYRIEAPGPGEYYLAGQRLGYVQTVSDLLAVGEATYGVDLELKPDPFHFDPLEVTVRNEQLIDWFVYELGGNPIASSGFRVIQGTDLLEAKARARDNTDMLRWLYIPVTHAARPCVGWRIRPTRRAGDSREPREIPCGTLYLDGRNVPVEHIETLDRASIAVVAVLPPDVYLFTRAFDGTQPLIR